METRRTLRTCTFLALAGLLIPFSTPFSGDLVHPDAGIAARLDESGVTFRSRSGRDWSLRMTLEGPAVQQVGGDRNSVVARRGPVEERLDLRDGGIEHSFVVHEGPDGPFSLTMKVKAEGLDPRPRTTGGSVAFTRDGREAVRYEDLKVFDANGRTLASRMTWEDGRLALAVLEPGAYPIVVDPLAQNAAWEYFNPDPWPGEYLGSSITSGDFNADGQVDIAVGAIGYVNSQIAEGGVFVFLGGPSGPSGSPDWLDCSGQENARMGRSLATGDLNGDGYDELIVGIPRFDNTLQDQGAIYVYFGSPSGLTIIPGLILYGQKANSRLGVSVGCVDVNGDGLEDLLAGASLYGNGQNNEGAAYVHLGTSSGPGVLPDWTFEGNQVGARVGYAVAPAGDVNGDGYQDVIVGSWGWDNGELNEGAAFVFHGSAAGLSTTPDWTTEGNQDAARHGGAVASAGDVNGDGYDDVLVGAPRYDNGELDEGRVYVYHGSAAGLSTTPDWTHELNEEGANLGKTVSSAGDTNLDGFDDVIVGAPLWGTNDEGRAQLFHGSATGLETTSSWEKTGPLVTGLEYYGSCVASVGDVNADGRGDVMVAMEGHVVFTGGVSPQPCAGKVFLYYGEGGSGTPPPTTPPTTPPPPPPTHPAATGAEKEEDGGVCSAGAAATGNGAALFLTLILFAAAAWRRR